MMNPWSILLGIIGAINIILAIVIIFLERRNISSTWAWLMLLCFLPVLGFLLYLLLGQQFTLRRIFHWDRRAHYYVQQKVNQQERHLKQHDFCSNNPLIERYRSLVYLHLNDAEAILTENNRVQIFTDGEDKFASLFFDIARARHHIHLLYYIIRSDELGTRLINALIRKLHEGVQVRLLYDDTGSRQLSQKLIRRFRHAGGEIYPFFPAVLPGINLRINYRNHRKLVVIDGRIGYLGGFNVGDEYINRSTRFGFWRDTHLRIEGEAVNMLQSRFMLDWNQASKEDLSFIPFYDFSHHDYGQTGIQVVASGPNSEWEQIKKGYIKMILSASQSLYLQTPYLVPDDSLLDALRIAALSGIDVKIMIPNKPDHPFVYWASYAYAGELLRAGAKIYKYNKGFLHAKTLVIDEQIASVGSANIDVRSSRLDFELNAFIYDHQIAQKLANYFQYDLQQSTPLTWEEYQQRSSYIRLKESISRLLSPLL